MPQRLLPLLLEVPQSGTVLAGRLGVGRVRVNALACALRAEGYPVSITRQGYALAPGTPAPHLLALRGTFGRAYRYLGTTESTQDALRAWAADAIAPAPAGAVVLAERQTQGRGRRGRPWLAARETAGEQEPPAPAGLTFSVLLPAPPDAPEQSSTTQNSPAQGLAALGLWPLAAGVALHAAAGDFGVQAGLKWPNDLLDPSHRKLAGVLLEADLRGETVQRAVLGVGLNVSAAPAALSGDAGWLEAERMGAPLRRSDVLASLLVHLERWLAAPVDEVLAAWRAASYTLGREVRVQTPAGLLSGLAVDLDTDGALLVQPGRTASLVQPGGTGPPGAVSPGAGSPVRVSAGDVQLVGTFAGPAQAP